MARPAWKSRPDLREINDDLRSLAERTRVLPRVDQHGHSDCPFAAQLYEDAARALAKVEDNLSYQQLGRQEAFAAKSKAKEDLDALWVRLATDEDMDLDTYDRLKAEKRKDVQSVIEQITAIENKISECERALEAARDKIARGAMLLK